MPLEARLPLSLAVALAIVYCATPVAIRVASRFEFYDRPVGYKGHAAPTPYLGGAAVLAGFVVAVLLLGGEWDRTLPLLGGVAVLWAVGTLDDRRTLHPGTRVAIEAAVAALLWRAGLGWELGLGGVVDLAVSMLWIVAVVNAFNLFDNMDGAASTMAAVTAGGLAVYGVASGDTWLAVCAVALSGACLGFLPHNLFASPARIFLGDGGSLPIGFAVAGLAMAGISGTALPWQSLAMGLLFVGIPALDTVLVMVSRRRRGRSIMTGGRDHLTHRARTRLRTAAAVAFALGGAQAVVSALAVVAVRGGSSVIVVAVAAYLVAAGVAIAALDARYEPVTAAAVPVAASRGPRVDWVPLALLTPLAAAIGLSPFFGGFYSSGLWIPAGLVLVTAAAALLIARPFRLTWPAGLVLSGLTGLAVWSLLSARWADSVEDALVAGNRWLVYAVLALVLLAAVRTERAAAWLLGLISAFALVVAGVVTTRLLGADPVGAFLGPRLHEPLGYINGQGAFFVLAMWPCLAAAEQRRWALLSGAGLGAAALLGALAMLSQSRGVALGFVVSALVVLIAVPGRTRRFWTLLALAAALAPAVPGVLAVYDERASAASIHDAARVALLCAAVCGCVWGLLTALSTRAQRSFAWTPRLAAGLAAALLAVGVGGAAVSAGAIARTAGDQYDAFVALAPGPTESSRLLSGAGNRYDYWRVAWSAFRERPVVGVGAGNYPLPYFRERATSEDVRQPHSLELQTLAELGVVGAALLLMLLAGLAWGAAKSARAARGSLLVRATTVAGIGIAMAWIVHASVDWPHLIPGVTAVTLAATVALARARPAAPREAALAQPAAAASPLDAAAAQPAATGAPAHATASQSAAACHPRRRLGLVVAGALVLALAGLTLSRQGLAERYRFAAQHALANDPARALVEADRSLRIDPHAIDAYYVKAAALARFDEGPAAVATLEAAARRAPGNFVTWTLLGDLAVRMGDDQRAREHYARALALNPRDPSLARSGR